jgi:aspartate 1-decarboxylase
VVVSAIGHTTDRLIASAQDIADPPQPSALAELLATGERRSAALLTLTLDAVGVRVRSVDPREIGMLARGSVLDSEPIGVDAARTLDLFNDAAVLVIPGFFAYNELRQLHLLGRGSSDLSAVFLARSLRANRCRLVKDVDGVYESDPAASSSPTRRFLCVGYSRAAQAKLHRVRVTRADLHYEGSCGIDSDLLERSGIREYQHVEIYNVENGERFTTYAIAAPFGSGEICLNGAAARKAMTGDHLIICAYSTYSPTDFADYRPVVILVDDHNRPLYTPRQEGLTPSQALHCEAG